MKGKNSDPPITASFIEPHVIAAIRAAKDNAADVEVPRRTRRGVRPANTRKPRIIKRVTHPKAPPTKTSGSVDPVPVLRRHVKRALVKRCRPDRPKKRNGTGAAALDGLSYVRLLATAGLELMTFKQSRMMPRESLWQSRRRVFLIAGLVHATEGTAARITSGYIEADTLLLFAFVKDADITAMGQAVSNPDELVACREAIVSLRRAFINNRPFNPDHVGLLRRYGKFFTITHKPHLESQYESEDDE